MKKFLTIIFAVLCIGVTASAQSKAIGLRLGGDAEISYQHWLNRNFLETDLGLTFGNYGGLRLSGAYDFILTHPGNWNLYLGPAAQLGLYGGFAPDGTRTTNNFGLGLGLQFGVEYQIGSVPINISADWRPMWNIFASHGVWGSASLGFRYRF